jgi:ParB family chromosome partitioning protein
MEVGFARLGQKRRNHSMTTLQAITIPLSRLVKDEVNVRTREYAQDDVVRMAQSIEQTGLLAPLLVRPLSKRKNTEYGVIAGGRRLAALQLLESQGRLPEAYSSGIPSVPHTDASARQISLTENFERVNLSPVEEMKAFSELHGEGQKVSEISTRFGVSETLVKQRLALANVHPEIIAAFENDDLGLNELRAFATHDDQSVQLRVFQSLPSYSLHPNAIRHALKGEGVSVLDRVAKFVGLEAYESAGGQIVMDLFDPESSYLKDAGLLHDLAKDKLDKAADHVRASGWAWVEARFTLSYEEYSSFDRVHPVAPDLDDEQQSRLEQIDTTLEELSEQIETYEGDDAGYDALRDQFNGLDNERDELTKAVYSEEQIATSGVFISISHCGEIEISPAYTEHKSGSSTKKAPALPGEISSPLAADLNASLEADIQHKIRQSPDVAYLISTAWMIGSVFQQRSKVLCWPSEIKRRSVLAFQNARFEETIESFEAWAERIAEISDDLVGGLADWSPSDVKALHTFCASMLYSRESAAVEQYAVQHSSIRSLLGFDVYSDSSVDTAFFGRLTRGLLEGLHKALGGAPLAKTAKKGDIVPVVAKLAAKTNWRPEMNIAEGRHGKIFTMPDEQA